MLSIRTTARGFLILALLGSTAGAAFAMPAPVDPKSGPPPPKSTPHPSNQIVFPVLGSVEFTDDFGAPRPQGPHQGIDILAPRRAFALAAEPGRVRFYTGSSRAGCMLYLDGRSGTTYYYIHLNNDLTNRNDNRGGCKIGTTFPRGLRDGAQVAAGQLIGYVGDSGDADGVHPHLHFEVHPRGGAATNPYPFLIAARRLLFYATPGSYVTLTLSATVIAATAESLRVRVNTLKALPGGLTLRKLDRPLVLTVPPSAIVERGTAGRSADLANAKRGERVSVWTEPEAATPDVQTGKAGSISAERIFLPTP